MEQMKSIDKPAENKLAGKQYIDLPEYLLNFDVRKKAVENLNTKQYQEMEEKMMSGESDFSEDELIGYLNYLQNLEKEWHKVDSWYTTEQMKQIVNHFYLLKKKRISFSELNIESFKVKDGKIVVKFDDGNTEEISGGDLNNQSPPEYLDASFLQKEKTLECLLKTGGEKSIDKVIELILKDEKMAFLHEDNVVSLFKKNQPLAIKKLLTAASTGKLDVGQMYILIQPLADLIGNEECKRRMEKALTKLDKNNKDISTLAFILKAAKDAGEKIDWENIKELELDKKEIGSDLPQEEKEEVLAIAKENYLRDVYPDNLAAAKDVIENLEAELFGENGLKGQRTYILKYQGQIVAFCRFKPQGDGQLYAGSLNVEREVKNFCLGPYFLRQTLLEEARENDIVAITRANNPANKKYKELGFVFDSKSFIKNGVEYYNITLSRTDSMKEAA